MCGPGVRRGAEEGGAAEIDEEAGGVMKEDGAAVEVGSAGGS